MESVDDILNKAGIEFVKRLQDQIDSKNLNDTKEARNALSSVAKDGVLKIEGLLRTVVLSSGRRPGKFPPIDIIRDWVIRKLRVDPKDARGVAFVIARKIARQGTDIFTDNAKGLQIQLIIDDLNDEIFEEVNNQIALSVTNTLLKSYQT